MHLSKMDYSIIVFVFLYILTFSKNSFCVELTFELPDSAMECFYEQVEKGITANLEFQVITGGQYDVDAKIIAPDKQIIYEKQKTQFDSHQFTAQSSGIYAFCFSNEFSTFSHKLVYMEVTVGPEPALPGIADHLTALTQLESSAEQIHLSLNKIVDYQTHHRLREAQGRKRAEDLNERVMWWSIGETLAVILVTVTQVLVLKNFFSDKPSYSYKPLTKS